MKTNKTHFSKISNTIFVLIAIYALSFVWINYHLRNFKLAALASLIVLTFFCVIYYPIQIHINKKKQLKEHASLNQEKLKTQLLLNKINLNISLISQAFDLNNLCKTPSVNHFIHDNSEDIFFIFNKEELTNDDIISALQIREYNNITIFCISSPKFQEIDSLRIKIIQLDEIYKTICEKNIAIASNINVSKRPKLSAFNYLCIILCHERSRSYLGFGILLIISSLFTVYHSYYIIVGTILIMLSLYSRFNKRFN